MMPLLGNVAIIQNFPMNTKINIGDSSNKTERERMSIFIPLKITKWRHYKNAVDGVVLTTIQITEDLI